MFSVSAAFPQACFRVRALRPDACIGARTFPMCSARVSTALSIFAAPSLKRPFGDVARNAFDTSLLLCQCTTRAHWWPSTIDH